MTPRHYVIVGAGAVGCGLGGMLQHAGARVTFLARGAQLAALRDHGLTLATPSRSLHLAVAAVGSPAEVRFDDRCVVLLCTKSQDTEAALIALAASAPAETPIVCAQNGVDNEDRAARRFTRVHGMLVFSPLGYSAPGRVTLHAEPVLGGLDLGLHPHGTDALDAAIARDLGEAGFDARVEPNILRWKRGKLLSNLGNALQALGGAAAFEGPLLGLLHAEAIAVYAAGGLDHVTLDAVYQRNAAVVERPVEGAMRGGGSSWQSLARGTGSIEVDDLNGTIARLGTKYGVATPVNAALVALALRAAAERWPPEHLTRADLEVALTRL